MLCTFLFGCFKIYQNKCAKIIPINLIRTIVPIKYMPKISAVGLFCLYKFENNQTRTCTTFFRMSKITEPYFKSYFKSLAFEIFISLWFFLLKIGMLKFCLCLYKKVMLSFRGPSRNKNSRHPLRHPCKNIYEPP